MVELHASVILAAAAPTAYMARGALTLARGSPLSPRAVLRSEATGGALSTRCQDSAGPRRVLMSILTTQVLAPAEVLAHVTKRKPSLALALTISIGPGAGSGPGGPAACSAVLSSQQPHAATRSLRASPLGPRGGEPSLLGCRREPAAAL